MIRVEHGLTGLRNTERLRCIDTLHIHTPSVQRDTGRWSVADQRAIELAQQRHGTDIQILMVSDFCHQNVYVVLK